MTRSARILSISCVATAAAVAIALITGQADDTRRATFAQEPSPMTPAITVETVAYMHGEAELEGYVAYPAGDDKRPGVIIVHQWMGLSNHEEHRARMLAEAGYVAFAIDVYGRDSRPTDRDGAREQAGKYRGDRPLLRARVGAALDWLKSNPRVDADRTAAIGYCFGGGAVLELARSGADLNGVISFHGNLDTPNLDDAKNIKCAVCVHHGASDSGVTQESVTTFMQEMQAANVDWYLVQHGHALHGFTHEDNPERYNAQADARSWAAMLDFFNELFAR